MTTNTIENRTLPWFGLTTGETSEGVSSQELLQSSGLDFDVAIRPLWRRLGSGEFEQHQRDREVYRLDTEQTLGTVKSRYEIFQNRDAFAFGDSLVKDGHGEWVEAGCRNDGRHVFMTMKLGEGFTVAGQDAYDMYLFLRTSHDGSTGVSAHVVPFRVWCLNQTQLVMKSHVSSWTVPHTTNLAQKVAEAKTSLSLSQSYGAALQVQLENLVQKQVSHTHFEVLLQRIIPTTRPKRDEMIGEMLLNFNESPTINGFHNTAYGALNAVTEWYDHLKTQRTPVARFDSIMAGEGARMRNQLALALTA